MSAAGEAAASLGNGRQRLMANMHGAWRQLVVQAVQLPTSAAPPRLPLAAAGYETTANALAFAIYCLSTHPEAQARLLAEVDAFGSDKASWGLCGGHRVSGLPTQGRA